ncbi:MAG: hypothetical protein WD042_01050 [Phycisphaeraceae bacterium]
MITLHDYVWFGHIIKGHPELASHRHEVEQAVVLPEQIRISTSDADCRIYYGQASARGRRVALVADIVAGVVKTAYFARRIKAGVVEWSR